MPSPSASGARPDDLLAALDPEQRRVAEALRGPVRVLAGAGTGKTRAITHRIAYGVAQGVYQPSEVLALTFTTRAAGEMRTRLRQLGTDGVQARTFHAAALRQLRYFWPQLYGADLPTLTESKIGLLAAAARQARVRADQTALRDLASEIEWAKVSNVHPHEYATLGPERGREVSGATPAQIGAVFAAYESVKRDQGRIDFEDVLLLNAAMLADDERVAAQVRAQYKWFVVDEFQDVSPIQHALLELWLGGRDEVCVVGDPAQTIYSFAGADAGYLRGFHEKFPDAARIELVRNYRSTPQIVESANTLIAGTPSAGVTLQSQQVPGPAVVVTGYDDEVAEAESVAQAIEVLHRDGVPLSQMAVCFRINAQSENLEQALADRHIAYAVRGAARFFDRPEVREAVTRLRGTARGGLGTDNLAHDVRDVLAGMGWSSTPPARGSQRDKWESWQALVDQATVFAQQRADASTPSLGDFVDELDRRAADQHAPTAEGVTLLTMHAAKGLEWDAVFLIGCHEGTVPITYAQTPAAIEEERRLLYVGATRARHHLRISWSSARTPGRRGNRSASRFLDPLGGATAMAGSGRARGVKQRLAAKCKSCGRPLDTPAERKSRRCSQCPVAWHEPTYDALREWRLAKSHEIQKPAYVIFTDATMALLAEDRPTDEAGLQRISGIGPAKVETFGADILTVIATHLK